jgi:hypothetical protein
MTTRRRAAVGAALIVVVTAAAYFPALHAGFVFDDHKLIEQNPLLRGPLSRIWLPGTESRADGPRLAGRSPSQRSPLVGDSLAQLSPTRRF